MHSLNSLLTALITSLVVFSPISHSRTYYVDSEFGNDNWVGTEQNPTGNASNGPWQSLGRISAAQLVAGDIVKLRCGRTWTETLNIITSGSSSLPIIYTHYPDVCTEEKPVIQGSVAIPAHEWRTIDSYRRHVSRQFNLIPDSEFLSSLPLWKTWSPNNDSILDLSSACGNSQGYCLQLRSGTGTGNTVNYSPSFELSGQTNYTLRFSYFAAVGTRIRVIIRRSVNPFDDAGLSKSYFGTGKWETISEDFKSNRELKNARIDVEIPPGKFSAKIDSIRIEQKIPAAISLINGDRTLTPAHHPNAGYNTARPNSIYLANAEDSNLVANGAGGYGSDYVTASTDLTTEHLQKIVAGTPITVRVNAWLLEERTVRQVSGRRIYLDRATSFQLKKGWGYFFSGQSWMIDKANEWANDLSGNGIYTSLTVTPTTTPLRAVVLPYCVSASGTTGIILDGIDIRECGTAIDATNTRLMKIRNSKISRHENYGVYAPGAIYLDINDSEFSRIGMEAVNGLVPGTGFAQILRVMGSTFTEIGVELNNGLNYRIPRPSRGALYLGRDSTIESNLIRYTSYHGIRLAASNTVQDNIVDQTCLALDDCGGIYATGAASNGVIARNIVSNSVGWVDGKPVGTTSQSEGIYIDDHSEEIRVTSNTVSNSDHGIFIHNSSKNTVSQNKVFGSRRHEIWLLEDMNIIDPRGDLSGNVIENNLIFTTSASPSIRMESKIGSTDRFATFSGNRYSTLFSPRMASEASPSLSRTYTFSEWQGRSTGNSSASLAAPAATGGRDIDGSALESAGFATYQILSTNLIGHKINQSPISWTPWNETLPLSTAALENCAPGKCVELRAGGSTTLIASPPFSVTKDQSYRVSFDIQAPDGATGIAVVLRRGGGGNNGFEALSPFESVSTSTGFKRYSFSFKSPKTINESDPSTQDIGARIYFERLPNGKTLRIANLEIVEISPQEATVRSSLLSNHSAYTETFPCPTEASAPESCGNYFDFSTEETVTWPIALQPAETRIVYTQDLSLIDRDNDGIADITDLCAGTPAGAITNAAGCSLD